MKNYIYILFFILLFCFARNNVIAEQKDNVDIGFLFNKKFDKGMKTRIGQYSIEDLIGSPGYPTFPGTGDFLLGTVIVCYVNGKWKKVATLEDFRKAMFYSQDKKYKFDEYVKFRDAAQLNNAVYCAQGFIVYGASDCSYCNTLILPRYVSALDEKTKIFYNELSEIAKKEAQLYEKLSKTPQAQEYLQDELEELEEQKNQEKARLQQVKEERKKIVVIE